jgi:hypothetical protein
MFCDNARSSCIDVGRYLSVLHVSCISHEDLSRRPARSLASSVTTCQKRHRTCKAGNWTHTSMLGSISLARIFGVLGSVSCYVYYRDSCILRRIGDNSVHPAREGRPISRHMSNLVMDVLAVILAKLDP